MPLPKLVVFGEALTDLIRQPGGDGRQWVSRAGGACWNVARVCVAMGVPTGYGGAISTHAPFGTALLALSRDAGLDARYWQAVDAPPLVAVVHRHDPPAYFFLGEGAADLAFDPQALPPGWREATRVAHFGCISLVREPLAARLVALAEDLHARGVAISFDPNLRNLMGPGYFATFTRMAKLATWLKLSVEDLRALFPDHADADALAEVHRIAPHAGVLLTDGERGMQLRLADGTTLDQPAYKVEVADTVGAGDAAIGGWLASLSREPHAAVVEHLRRAAAAAALACTRTGAHAPRWDEVQALIASRSED
ncbi:carbohydrate kinase family protein [Pandoraea pulmonicola]|uniref:Aminoimidazole riboside kinase n=1 Tax=Pandoraea pulmonicola TaxID=93221 RepID=A0AAJ5CZQ6_PANPU|nr:carbohydrate kinase [Pandoraea pulmonicola]AJC21390.1 sugar kinase [Pandoraea pulmonicola]SUA89869.1 aminoimidazole riboside kinase [Pandoraea pulmonicola]